MKMKQLIEEQPCPDVSNNSSSSAVSRDDQEMSSNSMPVNGSISMKNSTCCGFLKGIDLNPARMLLAELMGTFLLMFCVCGIIASTQILRGEVGIMEYASTAGLTVVILVFSIGPISGAHFNPAITIAFAAFGQFPCSRVPLYVLAQTVGSVLATLAGRSVYGINPEVMATRAVQGYLSSFWVEFVATFIVMFLAASLAHQSQSIGQFSGFLFGIAIGLAVLISGPISGGSMNPARSLGPAIVSWNFKDAWIYVTAPVTGALAGALMFHALRLRREPCNPTTSSPDTSLLVHSIGFSRN